MFNTRTYQTASLSFLKRVSDSSSLTEAQMESLLLYRHVMSGDLSLAKAAKLRMKEGAPKPTKVGAYYRTVKQGKDNLKAAIMTVTAGIWLGYLKPEDLRQLFELAAKTPHPFEQEPPEHFWQVLQVLVEKMVT